MLFTGDAIAKASRHNHVSGTSVEEWAVERLRTSRYSALTNLSCKYRDGALVLRGELASFYLKQLAQVIVAQVAGIERIENHIEVRPERPTACACCLSLSIVEAEQKPIFVDGSRKRRTNGEARRAWYAKWRNIRFARYLNSC